MRRVNEALENVIVPIVEGFGYEFVGLQYFPQGKHSLLRLFVDKQGGITVEDCERVSRQVNAALSVESPVKEDYLLEVSSPGLDRLLFTPSQFGEFVGKQVAIRLSVPLEGKRNWKGRIDSVQTETVSLKLDEGSVTLSFADIAEARLVPEW